MVTGIIYKITCHETGEVYYGSTQYSLNKRITEHKSQCKRWKEGKTNYTTSFQIIERANYSYSLIEKVECETKKQLETRERMFIENNECVNKCIVGRTRKECNKAYKDAHREANREQNKEYNKMYYLKQKQLKELNQ